MKFRKSIKIAPGVKLNVTHKGVSSASIGGRGATLNVGKKGTKATVGIPGTGISHTETLTRNQTAYQAPQQESFLGRIIRGFFTFVVLSIGVMIAVAYLS